MREERGREGVDERAVDTDRVQQFQPVEQAAGLESFVAFVDGLDPRPYEPPGQHWARSTGGQAAVVDGSQVNKLRSEAGCATLGVDDVQMHVRLSIEMDLVARAESDGRVVELRLRRSDRLVTRGSRFALGQRSSWAKGLYRPAFTAGDLANRVRLHDAVLHDAVVTTCQKTGPVAVPLAPPVASLGRLAPDGEGEPLVRLDPVELNILGPNGVAQLIPGSVLPGEVPTIGLFERSRHRFPGDLVGDQARCAFDE